MNAGDEFTDILPQKDIWSLKFKMILWMTKTLCHQHKIDGQQFDK